VEWLNYDGYCAWSPLPPAGVTWPEPWGVRGVRFWVTVRDRDFDRNDIGQYGIGRPPRPFHGDMRSISHEPIGIHEFERITGRHLRPMPLEYGPTHVFMNPGRAEEHRGEVRHEGGPPERGHGNMEQGSRAPHEQQGRKELHRMVLPRHEQQRVERYRPRVERNVMVHHHEQNRSHSRESRGGRGHESHGGHKR
jgi:hypothetical protein